MIAKCYLKTNLDTLEKLYNKSTSAATGLLYSKSAILELCGWIEDSMDTIVRTCAHRTIKDINARKEIEKVVIDKTWGFDYEKYFRKMLIQVIGWRVVLELERKVDPAKFQNLKATLSTLNIYRNTEAHTHIRGITKRLDAPSVTKANFILVYDGLMDIDHKLRTLGC
jgi:hypothetical protein